MWIESGYTSNNINLFLSESGGIPQTIILGWNMIMNQGIIVWGTAFLDQPRWIQHFCFWDSWRFLTVKSLALRQSKFWSHPWKRMGSYGVMGF